jgi:ATP-dependent DNA helicase RecG
LVVVGTHALVEDTVVITNLGVVIIDEQHRFGVEQRMKLNAKANFPHCLYTTATPIPRSFMLTIFGDLDKTIIGELPPGRTPAATFFFKESMLSKVWTLCRQQLEQGRQVYIVYPLIEESATLDLKSAIDGYDAIRTGVFPEFSVGLMHGRLSGAEKTDIMTGFKAGAIRLLVATTVIEVGVDVPNATVMVIINAERFGLSQLHQLRGRVGRGHHRSYCILVGNPRTDVSRKRLEALVETSDGFVLAELDLKLRGPGELLGTRQSGLPNFKMADLVRDEPSLLLAQKAARRLFDVDPQLQRPEHARLARWFQSKTHFSTEQRLN